MWRLVKSLLFFTIIISLACEKGELVTAVDPLIELHAVYVTSQPVVDGRDNDEAWQKAIPYTIHVFEMTEDKKSLEMESGFNVTLKAVWWKEWLQGENEWIERPFLSILLTWPDDTKDITLDSWIYNPTDSTWRNSGNGTDWALFTWWSSPEYLDLWYWDASLTNPMGYAEDQHIQILQVDTTSYQEIYNIDGANFFNDFGDFKNTWDRNYNDNLTPRDSTDDYPKMAWKFDVDSIAPSLPRIFTSADENKYFLFSQDADLIENTPYLNPEGETFIPGYILEEPAGPAADIIAAARHENGYWTLEIVRPTATSDKDDNDKDFVPSSRYSFYSFQLSIGNNAKPPFRNDTQFFTQSGYTSFTFEFVQ